MLSQRSEISKILRLELGRRIKANPSYSLRAFARSLNCDPSLLSKIMSEKREASPSFILKLSQCSKEVREQIQELHKKEKLHTDKAQRYIPKQNYSQISLQSFEVISDPLHYKILELTKLKNFKPDPKWIAKFLSCSVHRVNEAADRLINLGFLRIEKSGKWCDTTGEVATHVIGANITTIAHKSHQKQILEEAIKALEQVPIEMRDQSSMMMTSSLDRIEKAKVLIKQFRRELCQFLEEAEEKDTLMQLSISLFPSNLEVNESKTKTKKNIKKDLDNEI